MRMNTIIGHFGFPCYSWLLSSVQASCLRTPLLLQETTSELWCLSGGKKGDYQKCSVLYCVLKLCTVISTLDNQFVHFSGLGLCHWAHFTVRRFICVYLFAFWVFTFFILAYNVFDGTLEFTQANPAFRIVFFQDLCLAIIGYQLRLQELAQVWAIAHSLLLNRVCSGTTYLSIYVTLNILSWSSTGFWRRTCFAEDSGA